MKTKIEDAVAASLRRNQGWLLATVRRWLRRGKDEK
jgi:hypothetical protein